MNNRTTAGLVFVSGGLLLLWARWAYGPVLGLNPGPNPATAAPRTLDPHAQSLLDQELHELEQRAALAGFDDPLEIPITKDCTHFGSCGFVSF